MKLGDINPGNIMKLQSAKNQFNKNHPKVEPFIKAIERKGIQEGMVIEMAVTMPDGEKLSSNIKVQQSDLELMNSLKDMIK